MPSVMDQPNPGSDAARERGCLCPVLDNCHGRFAPFPASGDLPDGWYIRGDCPMHGWEGGADA